MFKWFRKKEKDDIQSDLENYQLKLNIKSCCMFEKLTKKSFFECNTVEDTITLMYASFVTNNENMQMSLKTFQGLCENARIANWLSSKYRTISKCIEQFKDKSDNDDIEYSSEKKLPTVTNIATALIIEYGMNAQYVMNEMELWEMEMFVKEAEAKYKNEMATERLWTYLNIMPHIDSRKCKSPEKMLPFPWEKEQKEKVALADINKNKEAILKVFGKKKEEKNG